MVGDMGCTECNAEGVYNLLRSASVSCSRWLMTSRGLVGLFMTASLTEMPSRYCCSMVRKSAFSAASRARSFSTAALSKNACIQDWVLCIVYRLQARILSDNCSSVACTGHHAEAHRCCVLYDSEPAAGLWCSARDQLWGHAYKAMQSVCTLVRKCHHCNVWSEAFCTLL